MKACRAGVIVKQEPPDAGGAREADARGHEEDGALKSKCQVSVRRGAFAFSSRELCASGLIYSKAGGRSDLVEFNSECFRGERKHSTWRGSNAPRDLRYSHSAIGARRQRASDLERGISDSVLFDFCSCTPELRIASHAPRAPRPPPARRPWDVYAGAVSRVAARTLQMDLAPDT